MSIESQFVKNGSPIGFTTVDYGRQTGSTVRNTMLVELTSGDTIGCGFMRGTGNLGTVDVSVGQFSYERIN